MASSCRKLVPTGNPVPAHDAPAKTKDTYLAKFQSGVQASLDCMAEGIARTDNPVCAEECKGLDQKDDFMNSPVCRQCLTAATTTLPCGQANLFECADCADKQKVSIRGTNGDRDKLLHECLSVNTNIKTDNYLIIVTGTVLLLTVLALAGYYAWLLNTPRT